MLAGNARLTAESLKTGVRYTYRIQVNPRELELPTDSRSWYVQLLQGRDNNSDFSYVGMIRRGRFFVTAATRNLEKAPFVRGLDYIVRHLWRGVLPPDAQLWHSSTCGRCGRALTVPQSIRTGIGPECAKRMG